MGWRGCYLRLIRPIICSWFAHQGGRRSVLLVARSSLYSCPIVLTHLIGSLRSHCVPAYHQRGGDRQISRGAVKENGRAIMASNKTTRRIQRDARRDDGNETKDETRGIGNNGTRTRKQRDAGGMTGTEHEEQTKERDARRDDGTRDGETRRPLTKKRKDNDDNGDDTVPLLASTQHAQDDKSGYLFSSFARPPLPGSPYFVGLI